MFTQPIKAFDNVKKVFTEVMEANHHLMDLTPSNIIQYIKENLMALSCVRDQVVNDDVVFVTGLLKKNLSNLSEMEDCPKPDIVRAQAYIKDQYICSDIFSVLMRHFIYIEQLEHETLNCYKNVLLALTFHLDVRYCYKNDKKILSELFLCALYIYLLNRSKYEIHFSKMQGETKHNLDKEIINRCQALQNIMKICPDVQYEIEQDHLLLEEKSLVSIQSEIEKKITEFGGRNFLHMLREQFLIPYYKVCLKRYCIHRNKTVAGKIYDEVPVNFLILLALKTLNAADLKVTIECDKIKRAKKIVDLARDLLLVLQLNSPSVLEDIYITPANLNAYICNNMLFDKMVIPVQYNTDYLLDVMKDFFYTFDDQFVGKKYSIRTYIHVARKILEKGEGAFTLHSLKKLTQVRRKELNAILADISIDADKVNAEFTSVLKPTNCEDFPLIKMPDNTYYFFDTCISGIGFYRALYNQLNKMKETVTDLNNKLGKKMENYVKRLLTKRCFPYFTGKYSLKKGHTGECDVIIRNSNTICGIELKYTLLNKYFEIGEDVSLYSTLGKGMIKAQRQLLNHCIDLIQQKSLTLTDENQKSKELTYKDEKIISVSVCFSEYRFLTTKIVSENILNSVYYAKISLYDSSREEELKDFYTEQEKIRQLLVKVKKEKLFRNKLFRPFQNSLFLSLQQIYLMCKLCKNVDDFICFFNNQLTVITGTLDYYAELLYFLKSEYKDQK